MGSYALAAGKATPETVGLTRSCIALKQRDILAESTQIGGYTKTSNGVTGSERSVNCSCCGALSMGSIDGGGGVGIGTDVNIHGPAVPEAMTEEVAFESR